MLQYNSWNITARVYNSCSAESATNTVKSGSVKQASFRPKSSSGGCWTRHDAMNPSQPNTAWLSMALMEVTPKSMPFLWSVGFGRQCCVNWGGCGNRSQCGDCCLEEVQLKDKKKIYCSAWELLARGNPWSSLTNLATDSQQRVQNQDGGKRSHGHHLGVVTDNWPEGEHQYWAWDQDGNYNQRPVQPFKWNYPENLQRKRLQIISLVKSVLAH